MSTSIQNFWPPFDSAKILRNKKRILREFRSQPHQWTDKNIAILSGFSSTELRDQWEVFLLQRGIRPHFYECPFQRHIDTALFPPEDLIQFKPDIIYLAICYHNLPLHVLCQKASKIDAAFQDCLNQLRAACEALEKRFNCPVLINTIESPPFAPLGNLEDFLADSLTSHIAKFNCELQNISKIHRDLHLFHWAGLANEIGLRQWHSPRHWNAYKFPTDTIHFPEIGYRLSTWTCGLLGLAKKVLVLDMDDTLYGGVFSEEGMSIRLGPGIPQGEVFENFQRYILMLKQRGVVLAIVSKNDHDVVMKAFEHQHFLLQPSDFAGILANWNNKSDNIILLSQKLSLGLDSMVFVDNSSFEREEVKSQLPQVTVPNMGDDPELFAHILDNGHFFDVPSLSPEDQQRSQQYQMKSAFESEKAETGDYEQFLHQLNMKAELCPFQTEHLDRICQLINKSNQFNLTTQRLTLSQCEAIMNNPEYMTLSASLEDRHGHHGLVGLMIVKITLNHAHIENFIMSCRVLQRGLEDAMLQHLVAKLKSYPNLEYLRGTYIPTAKNHLVHDLFGRLGFNKVNEDSQGQTQWNLTLRDCSLESFNHQITIQ
jgi:FkbH-like protein